MENISLVLYFDVAQETCSTLYNGELAHSTNLTSTNVCRRLRRCFPLQFDKYYRKDIFNLRMFSMTEKIELYFYKEQ